MGERGFVCLRVFLTCLISFLFLINTGSLASAQTDVTTSIQLNKGRMTTNRATAIAQLDVALENIGSESIQGPLWAVIDSVTDQVTVENADGTTDQGKPYYLYDGELGDGNLVVQEISATKTWYFHNPNNLRFSYTVVVLAEPGDDQQPPAINITNPLAGALISNTTPWLTAVYQDDGSGIDASSFNASIDGTDVTAAFTVTASQAECRLSTPLDIGSHTLTVSINDNNGNTATADAVFQVTTSAAELKYLFSVADNDWIFASAGDGSYIEYIKGSDLGLNTFADVIGLSRALVNGPYYFTHAHGQGVLQTPADGTQTEHMANAAMGLSADDRILALHKGLDSLNYFALQGEPDIRQSDGSGAFSFFLQNEQLGLTDIDTLGCLHIGYDNTIYFCSPIGQEILNSTGDNTNTVFLTAAQLGVSGEQIDAFAIIPETTPPQLSIAHPTNGAFVNTTTPAFTISFNDTESGIATDSFHAELDGTDISSLFTVTATGASCQVDQGNALSVDNHSLSVSIQDRAGNQSQATSNFSVGVLRAIPGATPTSGTAPLTVHFTTDGEDPSGTIVAFRWDFFGDGSWDTYDTVARDYNRTFNTPGTYNARLQVSSSTGAAAIATIQITVLNNPPTASADIVPSNGEVPLTAQLHGSGSDPDGSIVLYEWDFDGDGIFDWSSTTTGNTTYTYTAVGSYQAVFRVTDNDGQTATALAATTVVNTGPPGSPTATASASPTTGNAPLNVNFNGTATDPNNDVVLYEWDFESDGTYDWSSANTGNTSHTYTQAGTHIARLRVTDSTGLSGIDQVVITVNIQTSLSVQNNTVGFLPGPLSMTASASSQLNSSYPPSRAVDGNTGTYWYSAYRDTAPESSWFQVVFGQPQRVFGFTVNWYNTSYKMQTGRVELYNQNDELIHSEDTALNGNPSTVALSTTVDDVVRLRLVTLTSSAIYHIMREFTPNSQDMPGSELNPTGTNITTSISADSQVSILLKDGMGNTVRTLVNNQFRTLGSYNDYWNCRDDNGAVVNDGVYYAVMQYIVDGNVQTYDLTQTTGGTRYSFPTGGGCNRRDSMTKSRFTPYADDFCPITFRLCDASEVTVFIGPLYTGGSETRIRTILNRKALPAGAHTIYWDGLNDQGNIAHPPPGDALILGMWRYSLPSNAIYMTGTRPVISNVSSEPNYFNPLSNTCLENGNAVDVRFTLNEAAQRVDLQVVDLETKNTVRIVNQYDLPSGQNHTFWDGRNDSGDFVEAGDYQLILTATDAEGNNSMLTTANLVRLTY